VKLGDVFSFEGKRNVTVLMVALILGLYAKFTGDSQPFSIFALIITAIFLFELVNFVMGKLGQ
jgi:phosphatidylglycerophosphate synthase